MLSVFSNFLPVIFIIFAFIFKDFFFFTIYVMYYNIRYSFGNLNQWLLYLYIWFTMNFGITLTITFRFKTLSRYLLILRKFFGNLLVFFYIGILLYLWLLWTWFLYFIIFKIKIIDFFFNFFIYFFQFFNILFILLLVFLFLYLFFVL